MNAAGLVLHLHQLKIVRGQKHTPVLDTEWQHGLRGQLGQIKIYQQKENKHGQTLAESQRELLE